MLGRIRKILGRSKLKDDLNFFEKILVSGIERYRKMKHSFSKSNNRTISRIYLKEKHIERKFVSRTYHFVSLEELLGWTKEWIKSFPEKYDLIVGIPRSGQLVANVIGAVLGTRITIPELFKEHPPWKSHWMPDDFECRNILLVDEAVGSGKQMKEALDLITSKAPKAKITTASLIVHKGSMELVDMYHRVVPYRWYFEWQMIVPHLGKLGSDLDGVLCENCPPHVDGFEDLYMEWIKNAKPYKIPPFEIDVIISSRLEKYRRETEEWLASYDVRYNKLLLWDLSSKAERGENSAKFKIEQLTIEKPDMFWESSLEQSSEIWKKTRIPTLCVDDMELFC